MYASTVHSCRLHYCNANQRKAFAVRIQYTAASCRIYIRLVLNRVSNQPPGCPKINSAQSVGQPGHPAIHHWSRLLQSTAYLFTYLPCRCRDIQHESRAIAKMTARCALLYGCAEKNRESLATPTARLLFPKLLIGFCCARSYESAYKIWSLQLYPFLR